MILRLCSVIDFESSPSDVVEKRDIRNVCICIRAFSKITDVIVADNRLKYKITSNKYKINFINKPNICEVFDESFPKKMIEFKTFEKLQNMYDIDETELFGTFNFFDISNVDKT